MSQQMKRKADELTKNDQQPSTSKTENSAKKLKTPANQGSQSSTPGATHVRGLVRGGIYRIECPELGDFHIRSGATGSFRVKAAGLKISNNEETIFPHPAVTLTAGAEVELKDNPSGITTLSVLPESLRAPPQNQNWLTTLVSEVVFGTPAPPPLHILGTVDKDIILNGGRDIEIIGDTRRVKISGSGSVTVQGSIQTVENNGTGKVKVNGAVKEQVRQTGVGSIVVYEDVTGNITNSGGGSIEVKGMHKGANKQINNSRGSINIGTGPNNGGIKEYYYTKNYKVIQL